MKSLSLSDRLHLPSRRVLMSITGFANIRPHATRATAITSNGDHSSANSPATCARSSVAAQAQLFGCANEPEVTPYRAFTAWADWSMDLTSLPPPDGSENHLGAW